MVWGDCSNRAGGGEELKGLRMGVEDGEVRRGCSLFLEFFFFFFKLKSTFKIEV